MKKRFFIIHGWGADPNYGGIPWLKQKLEKEGFVVSVPSMPTTDHPIIKDWVDFIAKKVGKINENTILIGHSIGVQAILRYLESLDNIKVGGLVLLAGFFNLNEKTYKNQAERKIARPWLTTKINCEKIKKNTSNIIAIFSDDDPYVPINDSELFAGRLGAEIIIEHNKQHFACEGGKKEWPSTLKSALEIVKRISN